MNKFFLILTVTFIILSKIIITEFWVPSFYDTNEDYITHSFAHGINMDLWLRGGQERYVNALQYLHPGLPFQFTSWLTYISFNWSRQTIDSVIYTLINADTLWKINQYFPFFLNIFFISLAILLFKIKEFKDFLIFFLLFYSFETTLTFSFFYLGNETFAIPIFIILAWSMEKAFDGGRFRFFLLTGILCGIAYLNKLNYIGWTLAVIGTLVITLIRNYRTFRIPVSVYRIILICLGFIFTITILSIIMLRKEGLRDMISAHGSVFFKSGLYGSGEAGILDLNKVKANILTFFLTQWKFGILLIILLGTSIYKWLFHYKLEIKKSNYSLFLILSFGVVFMIVMKQYATHYLIPAVVVVPFLYLNLRNYLNVHLKNSLLVLTGILVCINFFSILSHKSIMYHQDIKTGPDYIKEYNQELAHIRSLPLPKKERRMWYYRIKSFEYGSRMAINWSGTMSLHKNFDPFMSEDMIDLDVSPDNLPYYLIYQNNYDNLKADFKKQYEISYEGNHLRVYRRK